MTDAISKERIAEASDWIIAKASTSVAAARVLSTRHAETILALIAENEALRARCDHAASHENITCIKCGEEL